MDRTVLDRPLYARPYPGAWLTMIAALAVGVSSYLSLFRPELWPPSADPVGDIAMSNYRVYYAAAEAAIAGEDFYSASPSGLGDWYTFLYPPIVVVLFYPTLLVGEVTGYWLFVGLNVPVAAGIAWLIVRYVESMGRELGWIDVGLLFAFAYGATHTASTIYFGNVNLLLALAVAAGFYLLEIDRLTWARATGAGAILALAALVKPFVALTGLYLLRIRSYVAVVAAAATGIAGLSLGVLAFGLESTVRFFFEVMPGRSGSMDFVGGLPPDGLYYVTAQRPLSHLLWTVWPDAPVVALPVLTAVVLGAILAFFYRNVETRVDRLIAILATVVVMITFMTSFRHYLALLYFPAVALAYCWEDHPVQSVFVAGAVVMAYTDRPGDVLEALAVYPDPVVAVLEGPLAIASLQLYGMALMLLAAAVYKLRYADGRGLPAESTRRRGADDRLAPRRSARDAPSPEAPADSGSRSNPSAGDDPSG